MPPYVVPRNIHTHPKKDDWVFQQSGVFQEPKLFFFKGEGYSNPKSFYERDMDVVWNNTIIRCVTSMIV